MILPDDKLPLSPMTPFLSDLVWEIGTPTHSEPVTAFSIDSNGPYCLPFRVRFRDGAWRNAATGDVLKVHIEGWR